MQYTRVVEPAVAFGERAPKYGKNYMSYLARWPRRWGWARPWCGRRSSRWRRGPRKLAGGDHDVVDAPPLTRDTVIAGHPPAQLTVYNKQRQGHRGRDEATRVTAPRVTTRDGTASPGGNYRIVATRNEGAANSRVSNVGKFAVVNIEGRYLQHTAIKAAL